MDRRHVITREHIEEEWHLYTSMRHVKQRALTNSMNDETQKACRKVGDCGAAGGDLQLHSEVAPPSMWVNRASGESLAVRVKNRKRRTGPCRKKIEVNVTAEEGRSESEWRAKRRWKSTSVGVAPLLYFLESTDCGLFTFRTLPQDTGTTSRQTLHQSVRDRRTRSWIVCHGLSDSGSPRRRVLFPPTHSTAYRRTAANSKHQPGPRVQSAPHRSVRSALSRQL
jgi:hypothetical protein